MKTEMEEDDSGVVLPGTEVIGEAQENIEIHRFGEKPKE